MKEIGMTLFFKFDAIKKFIDDGGSVFVLMGEGGEAKTNINTLLEQYGIRVNNGESAVLSTLWNVLLYWWCH